MSPTEKRFDSSFLWNLHEMHLIIVFWKECIKKCVAGIYHKHLPAEPFTLPMTGQDF